MLRAINAVVARDLKRYLRSKTRLLSAVIRPLLWLWIVGSGLGSVIRIADAYQYQEFILPGLLGFSILFGGILTGLATTLDAEFGVMRMLVIAPFSHAWIVIARILSGGIISLTQVLTLILILLPFGYFASLSMVLTLFLALILAAWMCFALGMLFAVSFQGVENFAAIINFVLFPIFFLSGALYPLKNLPEFMHYVILINPLSYCVDLFQHIMGLGRITEFSVVVDVVMIIAFSIAFTGFACWRFSQYSIFENKTKRLL